MSRLRYVLLAALAAGFVAVAVVVAVVGRGGSAPPARSLGHGQLVSASATLSPQSLLFGQPIHVRVEAVVDRRQLDPRRVRLDAHWTPFQPVADAPKPIASATTSANGTPTCNAAAPALQTAIIAASTASIVRGGSQRSAR